MKTKVCSKCGEEKPVDQFHKCKRYGTQYRCKSCRSRKKLDSLREAGLRRCTHCKEVKSLEIDFYERKKGLGLYRSQCKPCYMKRAMETRDPIKCREAERRMYKTEKFKKKNTKRSLAIYWSDPEYYRMKQKARNIGTPVAVLKEVLERDKRCQLCGSVKNLQYDHVYPRSKGGKGTTSNLQMLCQRCNVFKSNHFFLPDGGMIINAR